MKTPSNPPLKKKAMKPEITLLFSLKSSLTRGQSLRREVDFFTTRGVQVQLFGPFYSINIESL